MEFQELPFAAAADTVAVAVGTEAELVAVGTVAVGTVAEVVAADTVAAAADTVADTVAAVAAVADTVVEEFVVEVVARFLLF